MGLDEFDLHFLETVPALIGIDEAGRGPLAGPVSAAAVYVNRAFYDSSWHRQFASQINDSKQLKESDREAVFEAMSAIPEGLIHYTCCMVEVEEIECLNILGATRKAMALCLDQLRSNDACPFEIPFEEEDWLFQNPRNPSIAQVLVDGRPLKPFPYPHTAIIKGDGKSLAIALASIIAKVTRDRFMQEQAPVYPNYGFETNKGYGTSKHIAALKACGPCKIHRASFLGQILSSD